MASNPQHQADILELIAATLPDTPALAQGDRIVTYAELERRSARLAAALSAAGLGVQAPVAIDLYNCNEWIEAYYGTIKNRFVPVSINYRYLDDELTYLLENSGSEAIVYHASLGDSVVDVARRMPAVKAIIRVDDVGDGTPPPDGVLDYEEIVTGGAAADPIVRSDDDVVMWYSGGTTGLPKGILIPVGRSTAMHASNEGRLRTLGRFQDPPESIDDDLAVAARRLVDDGTRPIALPASPLMHSTAISYAGPAIIACGGMITTLESRSFDAHELFRVVDRHRVTTITIVGDAFSVPMLRALQEATDRGEPYDGSSLMTIYSAGVVWSAGVKQQLFEHLPDVMLVDNCGSSEGAWYGTSIARKGDPTSSTAFVPAPGVLVLDENGEPMEPGAGRPGLLASRTNTKGYHNDDRKTAENFRMIDGEWYTTPGDLGILNADGTITLVGRGSLVINTGGEKVSPEEVDDVIKELPEVDDCLTIGMPDDTYGQIVSAVVQLRQGAQLEPEAITEFVRSRLARYKAPRRVFIVDRVPRLPNGKADYPGARQLAADRFANQG